MPAKDNGGKGGKKPTEQAAQGAAETETDLTWMSVERCGRRLGFGPDSMTAFIEAGAPIVGRKMNPRATHEWLIQHWRELGKIRPE